MQSTWWEHLDLLLSMFQHAFLMVIKIIYYGDQVFSGDNPFSNTLIPKQSKLKFAVGVCYVRITLIGLRESIWQ